MGHTRTPPDSGTCLTNCEYLTNYVSCLLVVGLGVVPEPAVLVVVGGSGDLGRDGPADMHGIGGRTEGETVHG